MLVETGAFKLDVGAPVEIPGKSVGAKGAVEGTLDPPTAPGTPEGAEVAMSMRPGEEPASAINSP